MLSVETVLFLVTAVGIASYCLAVWAMKKQGENAEAAFWSNVKHPLFYEMPDAMDVSREETKEQYKRALEMLEKHGNKWLGRNFSERKQNVFCWVWADDGNKSIINFEDWKKQKAIHRQEIFDAFYIFHSENREKAEKIKDKQQDTRQGQTVEFNDINI